MENSLENLIQQCKKRDRAAQKKVYETFGAELFSVCLRYASSYEDAQDNFQEGFVTIFNKIEQFKSKGSFIGWMKRIMINLSLEKARNYTFKDYYETENLSTTIDEETEPFYNALEYEKLILFVQNLPPQYQQVFNLYVFEEYSHQEIAEILKISVGTSKSNLSRARSILRKEIIKHQNSINNEQI